MVVSAVAIERHVRAVAQVGDQDRGVGVALLQELRRLDHRLAHVAMRAHHAVDLDLEISKCASEVIGTSLPHGRPALAAV